MDRLKTLKATRASIKHWIFDIQQPLKKGRRFIRRKTLVNYIVVWEDNGKKAPIGTVECALCILFHYNLNPDNVSYFCLKCPLTKIRHKCLWGSSAYSIFHRHPNLKNANYMIKILVKAYWYTYNKKEKQE